MSATWHGFVAGFLAGTALSVIAGFTVAAVIRRFAPKDPEETP